jgi:glutamine synthetase
MNFEANKDALMELDDSLKSRGIRYIQTETPDINGTLRGKLCARGKALSASGSAFCTILYGLSVRDDVYESRYSCFENGFPDAVSIADPSTAVILDADEGIASVICDMITEERDSYYPLSPRTALRRVVAKAEELGFQARFAVELEVYVVKVDRDRIGSGQMHDLEPLGRVQNAYSLARMDELRPLAAKFMDQMSAIGIEIDAMHTELGYGMIELAITHLPALEAADACSRVKLYLKQFLSLHGYAAVFMPKWKYEESGCGGHTHQSLWRDGKPVFADENKQFSKTGQQYVAGQLATLRDFSAVFYPTINAYRRMDALTWAPENVSWGMDNRTCALRVITQPNPSAYRIEHRCPGADVNGYLAIACMLGGGLIGIEQSMTPRPATEGSSINESDAVALPRSLEESVALFRQSGLVTEILGEELVEQYAISRDEECRLWREWQMKTISEWELVRYFDMH